MYSGLRRPRVAREFRSGTGEPEPIWCRAAGTHTLTPESGLSCGFRLSSNGAPGAPFRFSRDCQTSGDAEKRPRRFVETLETVLGDVHELTDLHARALISRDD